MYWHGTKSAAKKREKVLLGSPKTTNHSIESTPKKAAFSYALLMRSVDIMNRSPETNRLLTGKCLCEAVHYVVRDEFVYALNCHCSNCRRATGSAFKPFAGIESTKLNITVGKENLLIFGEDHAHDAH